MTHITHYFSESHQSYSNIHFFKKWLLVWYNWFPGIPSHLIMNSYTVAWPFPKHLGNNNFFMSQKMKIREGDCDWRQKPCCEMVGKYLDWIYTTEQLFLIFPELWPLLWEPDEPMDVSLEKCTWTHNQNFSYNLFYCILNWLPTQTI